MTFWLVAAAVVLAAIAPFVFESMRRSMDDRARKSAPGELADLPQGATHFQWQGPEDGPVAVCVHGLTTPSYVWSPIAGHLANRGFRVLTYDLYGRGFSARVKGRQDSTFFNAQLNALLAQQDVKDDITLLGYSMGGAIATSFAGSFPERIRKLCIIAPAGYGIDLGSFAMIAQRAGIVGYWYMLTFYGRILRKSVNAERHLPSSVPDIFDKQIAETRVKGFHYAVWSSLRGILSEDLEPAQSIIQERKIPTLAIWAEKDAVIPISGTDILREWNSDVKNIVIEGAEHAVAYVNVTEVCKSLDEFLEI
ncbi:MAG: alpha/beta hydrolase [Pseudomonadota bacterium]